MSTSRLWSRRKSIRDNGPPFLPHLTSLTITNSNVPDLSVRSASPRSQLPPALFTPSEAACILQGHSPRQAALRSRDAVEAYLGWQSSPVMKAPPHWAIGSEREMLHARQAVMAKAELRIEIDMAALATEVALRTLDSDSDTSSDSSHASASPEDARKTARSHRMRLLPDFVDEPQFVLPRLLVGDASTSNGTLSTASSCFGSLSPCTPADAATSYDGSREPMSQAGLDDDNNSIDKPPRKGRARMSQEKRRRLARRREREAMLFGLPPRSASAPAHQTTFGLFQVKPPLPTTSVREGGPSYASYAAMSRSGSVHSLLRPQTQDFLALPADNAACMLRRASAPTTLMQRRYEGGGLSSSLAYTPAMSMVEQAPVTCSWPPLPARGRSSYSSDATTNLMDRDTEQASMPSSTPPWRVVAP